MPIIKIPTAVRNSLGQVFVDKIDAGSGPGLIRFYTGVMPGADESPTTQTLLGTLTCSDPVAGVSNGTVTFGSIIQDDMADANGDAAWAQVLDSNLVTVCYLDVTGLAGTGAIKLNTITIVQGGPIRIASATITVGGA